MKLLKVSGVLVAAAGLGIFTVYAEGRPLGYGQDQEPNRRARELTVLAGRGAEIGVSIRDLEQSEADKQKVTGGGVIVDEVRLGSPAENAGLKRSDIVVEFDGEHVRSARQFSRLVQETAPGRKVTVTIMRDGRRSDLQMTPSEGRATSFMMDGDQLGDRIRERFGDFGGFAERMQPFAYNFDLPFLSSRGRLGLTVEALTSQLATYFGAKDGVLVTAVTDDSAAARAGVKAGDVISSLNGQPVRSSEDLVRGLRDVNDAEVSIGIVRDKRELTLKAKIEAPRRTLRGARPA